ncbi:hypothetical protein ACSBOB_33270 [Mesorhizobium sp. ASY16-5R]|uniref:hypothetical protein n=1 Tax=Mesorhizobium sp. ASY16-5R TaxID=3445772 RepID=UPI003FA00F98
MDWDALLELAAGRHLVVPFSFHELLGFEAAWKVPKECLASTIKAEIALLGLGDFVVKLVPSAVSTFAAVDKDLPVGFSVEFAVLLHQA